MTVWRTVDSGRTASDTPSMRKALVLAAVACLALASCGGDDDTGGSDADEPEAAPAAEDQEPAPAEETDDESASDASADLPLVGEAECPVQTGVGSAVAAFSSEGDGIFAADFCEWGVRSTLRPPDDVCAPYNPGLEEKGFYLTEIAVLDPEVGSQTAWLDVEEGAASLVAAEEWDSLWAEVTSGLDDDLGENRVGDDQASEVQEVDFSPGGFDGGTAHVLTVWDEGWPADQPTQSVLRGLVHTSATDPSTGETVPVAFVVVVNGFAPAFYNEGTTEPCAIVPETADGRGPFEIDADISTETLVDVAEQLLASAKLEWRSQ